MSFNDLAAALQARRQGNLYRQRRVLESAQGPEVSVDGRRYLAFCSNDYLGLANHPDVITALKRGADTYGVGGGASHLVNGHSRAHHALEEELAAFTGRERVLLFSTGYMANIGAINALIDRQDAVFQDRLNHASLLDAGLLSGARFQRYLHNDPESLAQRMARSEARRKLVVTDGVFSMDGDIADLPELSRVTREQGGWLMVDDAHGFGCLGNNGGGCVEHFGLSSEDVPVLIGTLGKGFGTSGAFVAGSEVLIETLIQFARTYIYTTSMSPAVAEATRTSLGLLQAESWRRDKLAQLIQRFRRGCSQLGYELMDSPTPIQPILIGEAGEAMRISAELEARGIFISAIRPPTVPAGSSRLRVTISAAHSEAQIDRLLEALDAVRGEVK
ncbi:8-amino-7-oxononanoate synthase [Marinobacterium sediminicola]|uniref:8-amino-7-oxononanoate synthase n=1 Tax=Marinobacterium sediminicola TaxID=518898 RepID=A0ABY1RZT2_9GAMM|nr:8-amino-7-oxononanoate synthase [Marinobacterium sediminicola]ULG70002.1 8-amino-7-oxononanoate synthase [Marinobacterium sediminicola]SMR74456.1 8-amino-7-oxononanoate synthase [Marinobacterium sediminicola]